MVFLKQQSTKESLGLSLHYFKKPIIRHQSIYVIRKSLPLQSKLSSLHTVITGTKSIFNHFTDWAHQLCGNIVTCLLCKSNIWAKTITLCLLQYSLNLFPPAFKKIRYFEAFLSLINIQYILKMNLHEELHGSSEFTAKQYISKECIFFHFFSCEIKVSDCFKELFSWLIVP